MSILAGQPQTSIEPMMLYMGRLARETARTLALASTDQKNAALEAMAERIEARSGAILESNKNDIDAARGNLHPVSRTLERIADIFGRLG